MAVPDIGEDPVGRDRLRPPSREKLPEVADRVLDPVEGLPGIGAVFVDQERREVIEARLVGVGQKASVGVVNTSSVLSWWARKRRTLLVK